MDIFQTQVQREFDGLRAEITTLRAALASTQAQLTASTAKSSQESKLPDPEKFAGSTYRFDTWLPLIKAKLSVDGSAIGDSTA
jgi:hypothetical protein